jgi:hypothetical protein
VLPAPPHPARSDSATADRSTPDAPPGELEQLVVAAADELADLSAEYERRGPWCNSVRPGAYSRTRSVSAEVWARSVHAMIDAGHLDELRGRVVSRDYLHRLVEELAAAADYLTGRNCMPGHEELGATLGRPTKPARLAMMAVMTPAARARAQARIDRNRARQVTNALAVLKAAGVLVCVEEGRMLTYLEKVELYANGVDRRYARAVYALTFPRAVKPVDNRPAGKLSAQPIFGPPRSGREVSYRSDLFVAFPSLSETNSESNRTCGWPTTTDHRLPAENDEKDGAARRPAPKKRALWELDREHYAFVVVLRKALPGQLGGESVRKLAGTTKRFYELGWDALSVAAAVVDLYDALGRHFPTYRPGKPAAWLGWALRQIDHTITPAIRRYDMWAAAGSELCRHEWPGGARISIVTGQPKCPSCRRAQST